MIYIIHHIMEYTLIEYTLYVANRDYTAWEWLPQPLPEGIATLSPLQHKLFHGDRVNAEGKIIASKYGGNTEIGGVLMVEEKTYGRYKDKLLYKCIPYDPHLPAFLIPYDEKTSLGFSKNKINKYITFKFLDWQEKHPYGIVVNTFGKVDETKAYADYQLHCQELNHSLKHFNAATLRVLREEAALNLPKLFIENYQIEDRRTYPILSIDPENCIDIDDALGIRKNAEGQTILSIYIANVPLMIEHLGLWQMITDRISTIYLPERKIPMLPSSLSDFRCSLLAGEERVAFTLDVYITKGYIVKYECKTCFIRVEKNYVYEAAELRARPDYQQLLKLVRHLNEESAGYLGYVEQVRDSHDVVEFCMIMMNYECAKILKKKGRGIFRSATKRKAQAQEADEEQAHITPQLKYIIQGTAGEYCLAAQMKPHELIAGGLETYVHITSPIRRLVDCINMLEIIRDTYTFSSAANAFVEKWLAKIAVLNQQSKAIRHLQNDILLLSTYEKNPHNDELYTGVVIGAAARGAARGAAPTTPFPTASGIATTPSPTASGIATTPTTASAAPLYKYRVYIAQLKLLTNVYSPKKVDNYSTMNFTIHLFLDEANMTKKVQLHMV